MATIRSVAELAGVSPATVSRVFSGSGYVSGEVRERVLAVAREQEFQPKKYKKQNRRLFYSIVGVIVPDICNTYYMDVIHGIERVLESHGVEVLICNTDENPQKEARCLTVLQQTDVAGIIMVPVSEAEQYNAERLIGMKNGGMPIVLLDRDVQGGSFDGVFMDNYNCAYQSICAFIRNGHTHIATIAGPSTSTSGLARLNGYRAALRDHGLPVREEYILHGDFKSELAYTLTRELIRTRTPVTAIFASNSRMSSGCLAALTECGVRVPEDMAFISCGRLEDYYKKISAVTYPAQAIGETCASILLEQMQAGKKARAPKKRVVFDMELTLRGSEVYPANRAHYFCK